MKHWWKIVPWVLMWSVVVLFVGLGVISTKQTLSYSSVCTHCLATRSGRERSILGISYENKYEAIRYLYETAGGLRLAKFSEGKQTVYEQIHGKSCEHDFVRTGFCRYRAGSVGCGGFGGSEEARGRNELMTVTFGVFEKVRNKGLAARSCLLIEREFPLTKPPRTGGQNLVKDSEERVEHYGQMLLFGELLGLVRNEEDWAAVLDYGAGGFKGDPPLLSEVRALVGRLERGQSAEYATAADILAMRSSTSNELLERMMKDENREVASTSKFHVIREKRLELFPLALVDYKLGEPQQLEIRKYSTEDFRSLFALGDKTVDELCEDAIWYADADHFALLEPILAALNRNDSPQARETVEKLLRGGNPYRRGGTPANRSAVYGPEQMWNEIETMNAPMELIRTTVSENLRGANFGMRMNFYEAVKGIGATHDRAEWEFLRESYLMGANTWALAVLGRVMHQLDAEATENFLIDDLRNCRRVPGTISAMGFIGSEKFAPVLEEFAARPRPTHLSKDNLPEGYFDADGDGTALLTYALHRCHGIPSWKLVKNAEGKYVIEKPLATSQ